MIVSELMTQRRESQGGRRKKVRKKKKKGAGIFIEKAQKKNPLEKGGSKKLGLRKNNRTTIGGEREPLYGPGALKEEHQQKENRQT